MSRRSEGQAPQARRKRNTPPCWGSWRPAAARRTSHGALACQRSDMHVAARRAAAPPHQVQQLVLLKQVGLLLLPDKLEQGGDRLLHLLRPDALGRHDSVRAWVQRIQCEMRKPCMRRHHMADVLYRRRWPQAAPLPHGLHVGWVQHNWLWAHYNTVKLQHATASNGEHEIWRGKPPV